MIVLCSMASVQSNNDICHTVIRYLCSPAMRCEHGKLSANSSRNQVRDWITEIEVSEFHLFFIANL